MSSANLTREETAQRSRTITAHTIAVNLDLTGATNPNTTGFPVTTTLTFDARTDSTWIDFIGETVTSVQVNGIEQPVNWDGARIQIDALAEHNTVRIQAVGAYSTSGEGLHRYVDPADGQTYLYTQYEPADSRRVMACFEQPDMKTRYSFTVTAPLGWQVLSNGAQESIATTEHAQTVTFAQTKPMSSYITAVAAGPYHRVDSYWQGAAQDENPQHVDLAVLCRASLAPHLDADEVIEVTRQGLDFYTREFGYEYPWGKYDQIFVPEYNLGAMENPGLVTFTENYVFRGPATASQHEGRANTILHEMAHMWFGDLVTMKWWDDLWLKESFADYMGAHVTAHATRFTDAWVTFANRRKAWAYQQDQLPTTHPIVADIPDLEAAKLNFDGITYAKGASALKQMVAYVGQTDFFEAARRYFARHAYGNTALSDLLAVLTEVSGKDMAAWSAAWLETTGVSTIEASNLGDDVTIRQIDPRPHRLQVELFSGSAEGSSEIRLVPIGTSDLTIEAESTTTTIPGWDGAALRLLNAGDWTYAKVRLDATSLRAVRTGLSTIPSALSRALVWSSLWNAVRDAQLPAQEFLDIAQTHAPYETSITLLTGVLANAHVALDDYLAPALRKELRARWLETAWQATLQAPAGSDHQLAWARAVGDAARTCTNRATNMLAMLRGEQPTPDGLELSADLRWKWLISLCATGVTGAHEADQELERDNTGSGHAAHVQALASLPTKESRDASWNAAWNDQTLTNEHLSATIAGFVAGGRTDLTAHHDAEYFNLIGSAWTQRSIEIARRLVVGLYPHDAPDELAASWLQANATAPGALRRLVTEQRDHAQRARAAQDYSARR